MKNYFIFPLTEFQVTRRYSEFLCSIYTLINQIDSVHQVRTRTERFSGALPQLSVSLTALAWVSLPFVLLKEVERLSGALPHVSLTALAWPRFLLSCKCYSFCVLSLPASLPHTGTYLSLSLPPPLPFPLNITSLVSPQN
jgi:hypothetical protein